MAISSSHRKGAAQHRAAPIPSRDLFAKVFDFDSNEDWEKADLEMVMWWMKQLVGLILGLLFGCYSPGFIGLPVFLVLQAVVAYIWSEKVGAVGIYNSLEDVFTGGVYAGFSTFLLSWIVSYTVLKR